MASINDGRAAPSTPELLGDLINQVTNLFRKEVQLAKAEVSEKVTVVVASLGAIVGGGVLALAALVVLLIGISELIASFGMAKHWASLLTAVLAAGIGYLILRSGLAGLQAKNLMPNKTVDQLSRDAAVAKEQVR